MEKGGGKNGTVAIPKSMQGVSSLTRHLSGGKYVFDWLVGWLFWA